MNHDVPAYGLWTLVILNSAIFVMFAFSFFKPQTARDWRTFGAFAAFIIALFVEMYGFPLSIYLMSGWLQTKYPNLDLMSHNSGHLWATLLGEKGDPHFGPLHIASYVFLGFGFYLLSSAWNVLYHSQRRNALATSGPYARIRHPQYPLCTAHRALEERPGRPLVAVTKLLLQVSLKPIAFADGRRRIQNC